MKDSTTDIKGRAGRGILVAGLAMSLGVLFLTACVDSKKPADSAATTQSQTKKNDKSMTSEFSFGKATITNSNKTMTGKPGSGTNAGQGSRMRGLEKTALISGQSGSSRTLDSSASLKASLAAEWCLL